jgi:hypothetical protein
MNRTLFNMRTTTTIHTAIAICKRDIYFGRVRGSIIEARKGAFGSIVDKTTGQTFCTNSIKHHQTPTMSVELERKRNLMLQKNELIFATISFDANRCFLAKYQTGFSDLSEDRKSLSNGENISPNFIYFHFTGLLHLALPSWFLSYFFSHVIVRH